MCRSTPNGSRYGYDRIKARFAHLLRYWKGDWYFYNGKCWEQRPDMPILLVRKAAELVILELRYVYAKNEGKEAQEARESRAKYSQLFESYKVSDRSGRFLSLLFGLCGSGV